MAEDGLQARAAQHVDAEFARAQQNFFREHLRQEKVQLSYYKSRLSGHDDNRRVAENRYVARISQIDAREQRAAIAMHKRHNSIRGKLDALTRAGRDRQADEREALQQRGHDLRAQATRNFNALQERQFEAKQADRIFAARSIKLFRVDHLDARQQQATIHHQTRDIKIEVRQQHMRDAAEQALRQQMRELHQQTQEGRARTRAG